MPLDPRRKAAQRTNAKARLRNAELALASAPWRELLNLPDDPSRFRARFEALGFQARTPDARQNSCLFVADPIGFLALKQTVDAVRRLADCIIQDRGVRGSRSRALFRSLRARFAPDSPEADALHRDMRTQAGIEGQRDTQALWRALADLKISSQGQWSTSTQAMEQDLSRQAGVSATVAEAFRMNLRCANETLEMFWELSPDVFKRLRRCRACGKYFLDKSQARHGEDCSRACRQKSHRRSRDGTMRVTHR